MRKVWELPILQKVWRVLPLTSIHACLSALGAVIGGIAGVNKDVDDANAVLK